MPTPMFDMQHVTPPSGNPAAGRSFLYIDSNTGKAWWKKSDGTLRRAEFQPSAIDSDLLPDANNTRNLGSSPVRWRDLFLSGALNVQGGVTLGDSHANIHTITGNTTFNGPFTSTNPSNHNDVNFQADLGKYVSLLLSRTTGRRWSLSLNPGTESGGNTGGHFELRRWLDNGISILCMYIDRTTGDITLGNDSGQTHTINGSLSLPNYPVAYGYLNTNVVITSSSPYTIEWTPVFGSGLSGTTFTVPTGSDGNYHVFCNLSAHIHGFTIFEILRNGAMVAREEGIPHAPVHQTFSVQWGGTLNAGDTITVRVTKWGSDHGDPVIKGGGEQRTTLLIRRV